MRAGDSWRPVFGDEGPGTLDRLIAARTPACVQSGTEDPREWAARTRREIVEALRLDPYAVVRSARVQRVHRREGFRVEVVRLETLPGIYMPANVYVPVGLGRKPLIVSPVGCGSGVSSPEVQALASNLALRGMTVLVTAGFCDNGVRGTLPDSDPPLGYARQLMGLPGDTTVHLQELLMALGWAAQSYPSIDPNRIGAAGYSYGGQMALYLAQLDLRIRSISIPATALGGACDEMRLPSDLWLESSTDHGPEFVWSAPLELPVMPANWRVAMLYPRGLHTTSGFHDWGAHPDVISSAMRYARDLWGTRASDRILFRADRGDHNHGRARREETYAWLESTLLGFSSHDPERRVPLFLRGELTVDISGTRTLASELAERIAAERRRRFRDAPPAHAASRARHAADRVFSGITSGPVREEAASVSSLAGIRVEGGRAEWAGVSFPVFRFERPGAATGGRALYLPRQGTAQEFGRIRELLESYRSVVSIDYVGVGESRSDRLLLHTAARYFMTDASSLPRLNVGLLRAWLESEAHGPYDLVADAWAPSMYALALAHLAPQRVGRVHASGVPPDELEYLASGRKVPDLLLQTGLFSQLTAAELAAALGAERLIGAI